MCAPLALAYSASIRLIFHRQHILQKTNEVGGETDVIKVVSDEDKHIRMLCLNLSNSLVDDVTRICWYSAY